MMSNSHLSLQLSTDVKCYMRNRWIGLYEKKKKSPFVTVWLWSPVGNSRLKSWTGSKGIPANHMWPNPAHQRKRSFVS